MTTRFAPHDYAELHCLSAFSFQRGASLPEELVQRAHALGYRALALTDECSVAGMVRAHEAARATGLKLLPGAEFGVALSSGGKGAKCTKEATGVDGPDALFRFLALAHDLQGWGNLCAFITAARRSAPKGQYVLRWHTQHRSTSRPKPSPAHAAPDTGAHTGMDEAADKAAGGFDAWPTLDGNEIILLLPPDLSVERACAIAVAARTRYGAAVWLGVSHRLGAQDAHTTVRMQHIAQFSGVPLVATGGVLMHLRSRKPLHDVVSAVRLGLPLAQCGRGLQPNAERHLRSRARLAAVFDAAHLANTLVVAQRCNFSLDSLRYHYPLEAVLPGHTPAQTLRQHTEEGALLRYPGGVPASVRTQLEHELALIAELRYEMYFLTVHDIVRFARSRNILCQGRGSAANSAVCYCLGVTEVDPVRMRVLFERFISRERDEPPDIDVDFEHQRREEVIQYIYTKYGRARAAITAVVTRYRPRSALRDVGRALGIPEELIGAMAKEHPGMYGRAVLAERLQSAIERAAHAAASSGDFVIPPPQRLQQWLDLATQLQGFPRHLSQHVGGFVLTQGPLTRIVPVENAAMPARSIVQWDKDDLDAVGLLKVDVLALGMLSAIHRCLDLVGQRRGTPMRMQDIPAEDPATYDMVCRADTVGVFQIESRAQMGMLPRLKPRCFYDLVVQVAIVRPGPIQGGMVHPYLQARANPHAVQYASPALEEVLKRTLGVPIFQEQVMQIAMAAADFSGGEADSLRRSMAAWKRKGGLQHFYDRLVGAMVAKGYTQEFADRLFRQIEGFGEYGFPESHAASFALLVYVSCWLKHHEPACFLAAMLNSQPLGFYAPSQLVQDARRHGVPVLPADVNHSDRDCTLEKLGSDPDLKSGSDPNFSNSFAVRLGLCMVGGLHATVAERIQRARAHKPFASTAELAQRCALDAGDLKALAAADALHSLSGHRRQQVWDASALRPAPPLLHGAPVHEEALALPAADASEEVVLDYAATGLSLRSHPVAFLRAELAGRALLNATQLRDLPHGRLARTCGLVTMRQQPHTAKGVVFVTLEDETGSTNVIVWKSLKEKQRAELLHARLLAVYGIWQRDPGGDVCHLVAKRLVDLTPLLGTLATHSRDFR